MMQRYLIILGAFCLAACATTDDGSANSDDGTGDFTIIDRSTPCPADQFQMLVGQRVDEIDRASLPQPVRVYGPDDAVTMDYRIDRMNVVFDESRIVTRVRCG